MAFRNLSWLLGFLGLLSSQSLALFDGCLSNNSCKLECTKKHIWIVGDTVTWTCMVTTDCDGLTSADIVFKRTEFTIQPDNIQVRDNITSQLIFTNVTLDHNGSYFSYVGPQVCFSEEIELQIGNIPTPPEVEVIYQISSDVAEYVNVIAKPKEDDVPTNWDIRYTVSVSERGFDKLVDMCETFTIGVIPQPCPALHSNVCQLINSEESECLLHGNYSFLVTMVTDFGNATTVKNVTVSKEIARAPAVFEMSVITTSRAVKVRWRMYLDLLSDIIFRVTHKLARANVWKEYIELDQTSYHFLKLKPAQRYLVQIESRLRESPFWTTQQISFMTNEDVPDRSPNLSTGSYTFVPSPCQINCTLLLYTQMISELERNGNLTSIEVTIKTHDLNNNNTVQLLEVDDTLKMNDINPAYSYIIHLRYCTEIGCSVFPSSISIPPAEKAPMKPQNIQVKPHQGDYVNISWSIDAKLSSMTEDFAVTVHYCKASIEWYRIPICEADYKWITVPGNTTHYIVNLTDLADTMFGVSMEIDGLSSGVTWVPGLSSDQISPEIDDGKFMYDPFPLYAAIICGVVIVFLVIACVFFRRIFNNCKSNGFKFAYPPKLETGSFGFSTNSSYTIVTSTTTDASNLINAVDQRLCLKQSDGQVEIDMESSQSEQGVEMQDNQSQSMIEKGDSQPQSKMVKDSQSQKGFETPLNQSKSQMEKDGSQSEDLIEYDSTDSESESPYIKQRDETKSEKKDLTQYESTDSDSESLNKDEVNNEKKKVPSKKNVSNQNSVDEYCVATKEDTQSSVSSSQPGTSGKTQENVHRDKSEVRNQNQAPYFPSGCSETIL